MPYSGGGRGGMRKERFLVTARMGQVQLGKYPRRWFEIPGGTF